MKAIALALSVAVACAASSAHAQEANCTPNAADKVKLSRLDAAWRAALSDARTAGHRQTLKVLGAVARPDAGLRGRPQPSPGLYRCRTVKLGAQPGMLPFVAYPYFRCQVDISPGGNLTLTKLTGSQRQVGAVCPVPGRLEDRRTLFIGGMALGTQSGAPAYGEKPETDVAGVIERIGPRTWRLVTPWPAAESKLNILELIAR